MGSDSSTAVIKERTQLHSKALDAKQNMAVEANYVK